VIIKIIIYDHVVWFEAMITPTYSTTNFMKSFS